VAWITVTPVTAEVIVTVHDPLPGVGVPVEQLWLVGAPGPETIETVHIVPSGAFTNPLPGFTLT
jgi:hypothetical protein